MADNDIIFGEKALAFLTKPTATTPLGSGFPSRGPALPLLLFFYNLEMHTYVCFPLDYQSHTCSFPPFEKKKPKTKTFRAPSVTPGKWPTSCNTCLDTWKIACCLTEICHSSEFLCRMLRFSCSSQGRPFFVLMHKKMSVLVQTRIV